MDLGTMRKKVKQNAYATFASFDRDALLVFDNCMRFNAPGTPFYNGADRMKKAWNKFKLKFKDVDTKLAMERRAGGALQQPPGQQPEQQQQQQRSHHQRQPSATAAAEDVVKDPNAPQPLAARERVDGLMFGHALLLLADPFVVMVILKTLMRKMDEVLFHLDSFSPLLLSVDM